MIKKKSPWEFIETHKSKVSFAASVVTLCVICLGIHKVDAMLLQSEAKKQAAVEAVAKAAEPVVTSANVIAVGDNLYHSYLIDSGRSDTGAWNYDDIYTEVKDRVQEADLAFIDQETIFTPDHDTVSSYPSFATPEEVGDAIVDVGFDVIETATNHTDDFGDVYIEDTLNYWKTNHPDITVVGINESEAAKKEIAVKDVNGIKIAVMDYAYGSNTDLVRKSDKTYLVNYFDKDQIASDIEAAKKVSDCIIFVAHWGNEDDSNVSEYEKQWARFLNEQGVDVIIGGHPHVLQPFETMTNSQGKDTLIFYSLGNFVSTQQELPELLGGMGKFTIEKTTVSGESTVKVSAGEVDPLVMHYNKEKNVFKVYMLSDYTEELAAQHSVITETGLDFSLKNLKSTYDKIMALKVNPSDKTDLLDMVINNDGTMTKADGTILSESETHDILSGDREDTGVDSEEKASDSSEASSVESDEDSMEEDSEEENSEEAYSEDGEY